MTSGTTNSTTTSFDAKTFTAACVAAGLIAGATLITACGKAAEAVTPEQIQQQYGVAGAYTDDVSTPDGAMLCDPRPGHVGRRAQSAIVRPSPTSE